MKIAKVSLFTVLVICLSFVAITMFMAFVESISSVEGGTWIASTGSLLAFFSCIAAGFSYSKWLFKFDLKLPWPHLENRLWLRVVVFIMILIGMLYASSILGFFFFTSIASFDDKNWGLRIIYFTLLANCLGGIVASYRCLFSRRQKL